MLRNLQHTNSWLSFSVCVQFAKLVRNNREMVEELKKEIIHQVWCALIEATTYVVAYKGNWLKSNHSAYPRLR